LCELIVEEISTGMKDVNVYVAKAPSRTSMASLRDIVRLNKFEVSSIVMGRIDGAMKLWVQT